MKKYFVLGFLFVLPLVAYMFFAAADHNFKMLPTLAGPVTSFSAFNVTQNGASVSFENNITVLGFLGSNVKDRFGQVFNLAHKIYSPYSEFYDLQFVMVVPKGSEDPVPELIDQLDKIKDAHKWQFLFADAAEIETVFADLNSPYDLERDLGSDYMYILDKDAMLRGRTDDEDLGTLHGYDATNVAELDDKMDDDIQVILAEYRRALKKNDKYKRKNL